MKIRSTVPAAAVLALLAAGVVWSGTPEKLKKEFTGKDKVKIEAVSGDVVVTTRSGSTVTVEVVYDVTPKEAFTPVIREQGSTLRLKEEWRGQRSNGSVTWNLLVPPETEIEFEAASGDIAVTGLRASFDAKTASGDVELTDIQGDVEISVASGDITLDHIKGDIDVSTASGEVEGDNLDGMVNVSCASGDIDIRDARGVFSVSCASGDVDVRNVTLAAASEFSAASGDVSVVLAETARFDVTVSTASGDAMLDYNGNEVKGFFEMKAKKRSGHIISPFAFDNEEEYEKGGDTYLKKSFSRSGDSPVVHIRTASGKAELRQ
ncbi:DUF4097 family beta strand repeat protein [bacterium]|nr:DUF4097 family beta strand repeat protein [bacterium]